MSNVDFFIDASIGDISKSKEIRHSNVNEKDGKGCSPLMYAVAADNVANVEYLIDIGADLNLLDNEGLSVLHIALFKKLVGILEILLKHGANPGIADRSCLTVLHHSIFCGLTIFKTVVDALDPSLIDIQDNEGRTAIHYCCQAGYFEMMSILLDKGSNVHVMDVNRRTPLHYACISKQPSARMEMVTKLVDHNSSLAEYQDVHGKTCLHLAVAENDLELVKFLTTARPLMVNIGDNLQRTPLHYSVLSESKVEILAFLLFEVSQTDVLIKDSVSGGTIIHYLCQNFDEDKWTELVRYMKTKGWTILDRVRDSNQCTPLHWAILSNNLQAFNSVLPWFPEEAFDKNGNSFLHTSASIGNRVILSEILKAYKSDINLKDKRGVTPLMRASDSKGSVGIVKLLLDSGANIKEVSSKKRSALHWAALKGNAKVLELYVDALLLKGDTIEYFEREDSAGFTVVCCAAYAGKIECLKVLFKKASLFDSTFRNSSGGYTPLHRAVLGRQLETVKYLLDHQAMDINSKVGDAPAASDEQSKKRSSTAFVEEQHKKSSMFGEQHAGKTALDLAFDSRSQPIIKFLMEQGALVASALDEDQS